MSLFPQLVPTLVDLLALLNSPVGLYLILYESCIFQHFPKRSSETFEIHLLVVFSLLASFQKDQGVYSSEWKEY